MNNQILNILEKSRKAKNKNAEMYYNNQRYLEEMWKG